MIKSLLQIIGFLLVITVIVVSVLFYLDSKGFITEEFSLFLRDIKTNIDQVKDKSSDFFEESGIRDDAANLLESGIDLIRGKGKAEPTPTPDPTGGLDILTFGFSTPTP